LWRFVVRSGIFLEEVEELSKVPDCCSEDDTTDAPVTSASDQPVLLEAGSWQLFRTPP
jgi:hypothetical protein